ncbi:hypothetical protein SynPROSU1_01961 [Synechococcus sp. PROS-U-1]|nr:hypothetical protein SynPROSU1_01961 [Synechococcus sp. PROS-U-1]
MRFNGRRCSSPKQTLDTAVDDSLPDRMGHPSGWRASAMA